MFTDRTYQQSKVKATLYPSLVSTFCLVVLPACSNLAGPDYQRPSIDVPTKYSQATGAQISAVEVIRPDWWTGFSDPYLNTIVQQAIDDNLELKILVARIEQAGAELGGAENRFLPTLNVTGKAQKIRRRAEISGPLGLAIGPSGPQLLPGKSTYQTASDTEYSAQGLLNWEIDIWGKLRKGAEAAEASYKATEADWRATYLSVVSAVADTYFQIHLLDEQIAQQQRALANNEQILRIYEAQLNEGITSSTQVLSQRAEVNRLRSQLEDLNRQRILAENGLATLLGKPAGNLKVPVAPLRKTVHSVEVPTGLPSDLLARRPDIIAAEYRVLQVHNLTGEARLARLPSISLTGSGGASSNILSSFLKSWTLGIGPSIDLPIFDPSLQTKVKIKEAETQEAEEQYRQTVIKAFEEVENALTNLTYHQEQKKQLEAQVADLRTVRNQIQAQVREGIVSQLQVFETERSLLEAEQSLLAIHQQILSDTVTLYKALGGGWPKEAVRANRQLVSSRDSG